MKRPGELTPAEAAEILGFGYDGGPKTVIRMCDRGELEHRIVRYKERRRIYVSESSVRQWLEGEGERFPGNAPNYPKSPNCLS